MIIRIILTVIFAIIGVYKYKKSLIHEIDHNPKLIKDNKLNFTTSAIPYTLFKVFVVYAICLIVSLFVLESQCNNLVLTEKYILEDKINYKDSDNKNQKISFNIEDEEIVINNLSKIINKSADENSVEVYERKSKYEIINFLLWNSYSKEVIINTIKEE